jgi:hypothetical protein
MPRFSSPAKERAREPYWCEMKYNQFPPAAAAMDYTFLDLQLRDSGNKQIKKIPISHRTFLAF